MAKIVKRCEIKMKFFIYLCCIAHLLTEISARLRLTTPMLSALRSNDDAARQASNIARIDFINSVFNEDGRSKARSSRYDPTLRRFELPVVQGISIFPSSIVVPNDEDMENQLEKLQDTARYHVIDNPEVLEEYSNKQKLKNIARLLKPGSETSAEAKAFSTVENKLIYYHSKSKSATSRNSTESNTFNQSHHKPNPNPLTGLQELTTVERTYRPSFPDDDDDDDEKLVTEDIEVTVTEKEINKPRANAKKHGGNTEKQPEINNTVEIEKRTRDNKALDKDKARIEEEKAQIDDTKEVGQIKQELPLKTEKYNDGVTVEEEKSGSYKEHLSSKPDHNSNENMSVGNVRPRDKDYKNDGNKLINGTTDTNSDKNKTPKERAWDTNIVINVPVERLMGRIYKSALTTKQNNNYHDQKEQHSIYAHKERKENSNKKSKHRHEKRHEHDRKKKDKYDDGWSKKEKDWNRIDKQRYNKDIEYDRMEHEWNKRHQQYDESDNLDMNDNQWDKNDDFNSRDYDSNKKDDDWEKRDNNWQKRNNGWDKIDKAWKKRDNGRNNRDIDSKKRDNVWNKRDIEANKRDDDWNKRDVDSNKRDNNWNKRENEWIKQESKPYKDGRNKNYWDPKQNEWDNKYSEINVENDMGIHDRYQIVERKRKYGDFNQYSEV